MTKFDASKFDVVLDETDPDFAEKLREALGLEAGETLNIITPQFDRDDGRKVTYIPKTVREYDALTRLGKDELKSVGCSLWDDEGGFLHWLYPAEWYDFIPDGYVMTDICGKEEKFKAGKTDNDQRFGCLAYGFKQSIN